jgi:hypothetical protein
MAPEDIIIKAKRGDETNYSQRTLKQLQSMSDDKLSLSSEGKVVVEQCDGETTEATKLIRDLVDSDKKIVVTNDVTGMSLGTKKLTDESLETNAFTIANDSKNASDGTGTGSKVLYSPDTQAKFTTKEGTREKSAPNTVLIHELIHAYNNITGTREVGKKPNNSNFKSNREEEKTIQRENIIRDQLNQPKRDDGSK